MLNETLTMDGRGKVLQASTTGIVGTDARSAYSGLGNLVASEWSRSFVPEETEHWRTDALGNPYWYRRFTDGPDPETRYSYESGSHALSSTRTRNPDRCTPPAIWTEEVGYDYDEAGSGSREFGISYSDTLCFQQQTRFRDTRSYYAADGKLRVFQRTTDNSVVGQRRVYEEYRYDALGRRVFLRSRPDSTCSASYCGGLTVTERYVWDGDELLLEDRSDAAGQGGNILYVHGSGIDQPLAVYKSGSLVVPHATWRGVYVSGTFANGTSAQLSLDWPGQYMYAYLNTPPREPQTWWGSLLRANLDNSGLMYRRNRYYDPATGRFTQEDPIGIAGGLNQYGYAGGDPVNFSDPFGLCTEADHWADCDKMISAQLGVQLLANAITSGEWTYSQSPSGGGHGLDPTSALPGQTLGDGTDFCRAATRGTLGSLWSSSHKASTGMFKSGDHSGFTEVESGSAQTGDVVVQGGHAGIFIGRDHGSVWAWANNGSPHNAKGTGYSDKDTGARKFNNGSFGTGDPRFYRPITP